MVDSKPAWWVRTIRLFGWIVLWCFIFFAALWCTLALYYSNLPARICEPINPARRSIEYHNTFRIGHLVADLKALHQSISAPIADSTPCVCLNNSV